MESDFHRRLYRCGMVQIFLSSGPAWLSHAISSQSCWASPAPLGASVPPSVRLGRDEWPCVGSIFMGTQHVVVSSCLCRYTHVPWWVSCSHWTCPRLDGVSRTCCTATFDLLLRLWVWPRPRSRLLREVWACIPAQRPWARRGGLGRARTACRACGQGDKGTWGARPFFPDSGSWAQGTARPHPSLPSLTPYTWPLYSELPKLALME